ncbi:peptide MFS transporter [Legionella gresilensis]|uniref:peptide MFS transporter n=1 Tax=Legionella gresilensis TaxID=91823 RepID=UPI00104161E9|nr:oligopeptide:H+ symporter [Legionella gresilensis]
MENTIKQPPALRVFFATEMWERYGFYVVQSLLALYMALHFKWPDKQVYALVGSFTALTYLSPIIGGWIADQLLGQKRTILTGAFFLFISYIALAFVTSTQGLITALAGVAVGTGLLKPNISSLLGNAYDTDAPQKERGFTIFYMGITSGIILGTTLPSYLNLYFGWPVAFTSAAFGMIIAALVFTMGAKRYNICDYQPYQYSSNKIIKAALLIAVLWSISFFILFYPHFADLAFGFVVLLSLSYLILTYIHEPAKQANQTMVISLLCIISVMFWAFYFQMFLSLTLFIARVVKPTLLGIKFPPPYYVSIQSFGMLFFGYFMSKNKKKLTLEQSGIRTGNKFLLAMCFTTLAYVFILLVCHFSENSNVLLSPLLFIPTYLLISIAELLLSPVGLAAITTLASREKVSTMMGIFFVSLGIGAYLSGKLANLTAIAPESMTIVELKQHYSHTFTHMFTVLLSATAICMVLNKIIKFLLVKYANYSTSFTKTPSNTSMSNV